MMLTSQLPIYSGVVCRETTIVVSPTYSTYTGEALPSLSSAELQLFLGKYGALDFGMNDAVECVVLDMFYYNYVRIVQAVINLSKMPFVSHIPWGKHKYPELWISIKCQD
jgi:hypothetical protein